jgi:hypothetical protein
MEGWDGVGGIANGYWYHPHISFVAYKEFLYICHTFGFLIEWCFGDPVGEIALHQRNSDLEA